MNTPLPSITQTPTVATIRLYGPKYSHAHGIIMAIQSFGGKIVLNSTGIVELSSGQNTSWQVSLSFVDNTGASLGTDVSVGDIVLFDTQSIHAGTFTAYKVVSIITQTYSSVTMVIRYQPSNTLPTPPDLSALAGMPGAITRRCGRDGEVALPLTDVQLLPTAFATSATNSNYRTNAVRIGIIGDSISTMQTARTIAWSQVLESMLNQTGTRATVLNFAVGGYRCYTALRVTTDFGGLTSVERCIESDPDVVLIVLGANDAASDRTLDQILEDARELVRTLRLGLPHSKLIFVTETLFDRSNFTPATLKNKGVIPYLKTLPLTGILEGCFSDEALELPASANTMNIVTKSVAFNAAIPAIAELDGYFDYDHWKVSRLGCMMYDGLHPDAVGMQLMATAIINGLVTLPVASTLFPGLKEQVAKLTVDMDSVFDVFLSPLADGYTPNPPSTFGESVAFESGIFRRFHPDTWWFPYKTRVNISPLVLPPTILSQAVVLVDGGPPNSVVFTSINGQPFAPTGVTTNAHGRGILTLPRTFFPGTGTHITRIKVSNEIYGPYQVVIQSDVVIPYGTTNSTLATTEFVDQYRDVRQNLQTTPYTMSLVDRGCSVDTTSNVIIPANSVTLFPIGSVVSVTNMGASGITISITTDTLRLSGTMSTGTRNLAPWGMATLRKIADTVWVIRGDGLT